MVCCSKTRDFGSAGRRVRPQGGGSRRAGAEQEEKHEANAAELNDADWLTAIEIITPEGVTVSSMEDVKNLITIEAGSGITEPTVRMEPTEDGFKLFGDAYEKGRPARL